MNQCKLGAYAYRSNRTHQARQRNKHENITCFCFLLLSACSHHWSYSRDLIPILHPNAAAMTAPHPSPPRRPPAPPAPPPAPRSRPRPPPGPRRCGPGGAGWPRASPRTASPCAPPAAPASVRGLCVYIHMREPSRAGGGGRGGAVEGYVDGMAGRVESNRSNSPPTPRISPPGAAGRPTARRACCPQSAPSRPATPGAARPGPPPRPFPPLSRSGGRGAAPGFSPPGGLAACLCRTRGVVVLGDERVNQSGLPFLYTSPDAPLQLLAVVQLHHRHAALPRAPLVGVVVVRRGFHERVEPRLGRDDGVVALLLVIIRRLIDSVGGYIHVNQSMINESSIRPPKPSTY